MLRRNDSMTPEPVAPPTSPQHEAASMSMTAFVRPGLLLGGSVVAANAMNAAFQFSLARLLLPGEYALLAALFAVTMVAAIPPVALETSLAREVALDLADRREAAAGAALRETLRALRAWIVGVLAVAIVAYTVVAVAGDRRSTAVLATGVTVATALALPVAWGALQGSGRFAALGLAQVCFAGT